MWKKVPFCLKPLNLWLGCILGYSCPSTEKNVSMAFSIYTSVSQTWSANSKGPLSIPDGVRQLMFKM